MDSIRSFIVDRLKERGLDMREASLAMGRNHAYLQQFLNRGVPRTLSEDAREGLAKLLGVSEDTLREPRSRKPELLINPAHKIEGTFPALSAKVQSDALIRVLGMAECGPDGESLWNGDVVDYVPRPPNLSGATRAYAVFAQGTSMEPRYHAGELVYIHPDKPVTPGCYVLVQRLPKEEGSPPRAVLKRLAKRSGNKVVLIQYNPEKTFILATDEIVSMHRVVGSGEA